MSELLEVAGYDELLWLVGGREQIPDGAMRIAQAQSALRTGTLRSRAGSVRLYANPTGGIQSLFQLSNDRFAIDDESGITKVWRDGIQIFPPANVIFNGAARASADSAAPHFGANVQEFVCGVGTPFKIDLSGNITQWGIAPPPDGMSGVASDVINTTLDLMNSTTGWALTNGTLSVDHSDFTFGNGSLNIATGTTKASFTLTKSSLLVNLAGSTPPNLDMDMIAFDMKIDLPQNVREMVVEFDLGTGFTTDYYTLAIPVINLIAANNYVRSTADLTAVDALVQQFLLNPQFVPTPAIQSQLTSDYYAGLQAFYKNAPHSFKTAPKLQVGAKSLTSFALALVGAIASGTNQWWTLRLPKAAFTRIGKNTALNWANVSGVRFKFQNLSQTTGTAQAINVHLDNLRLIGGTGLYGQYGYLVSFANTTTGSYSNPNPTTVIVPNVFRQQVTLSTIPVSTDPQVNARYIWRTVGNGGLLYLCGIIPNNTTTIFVDQVSDFIGLNTSASWNISSTYAAGVIIVDNNGNLQQSNGGSSGTITPVWSKTLNGMTSDGSITWTLIAIGSVFINTGGQSPVAQAFGSLSLEALTYINILPSPTISQVVEFNGTLFACGDSAFGGRVYYSAVGYAEGVAGFTDITGGADDPTQGMAVFNNNLYVFTRQGVYIAVDLTQAPVAPAWGFVQVLSIPGTVAPFSIQVTEIGIIYQASDGLRFFNGYEAPLIVPQILPLFRGESLEGVASIGTILSSCLGRNEYWFTDLVHTYTVTLKPPQNSTDTDKFLVRNVAPPHGAVSTISYEERTGLIIAGVNNNAWISLEDPTTFTDYDGGINIDWMPKFFYSGEKFKYKVQRVFVDAKLNGNTLSCTLWTDNLSSLHPTTLTGTTRQLFELGFNQSGRLVGVEITGTVTSLVEIFRILIEVEKVTDDR